VEKPAEPDSPPRPQPGASETDDERVGPVAIARHVKADGRALILYTRAERERA
jgi:hypothetical protein